MRQRKDIRDKRSAITHNPVWQIIGIIVALVSLGRTVCTFLTPPSEPSAAVTVKTSPPPPLPKQRIGLGQTVTGTLYFNEGIEWVFSDGPAVINVILDAGPHGDSLLMFFDSGGSQREYVDAQVGSEERLINHTIPDNGDYTIIIFNTKNEQADYTLTVEAASH